MAIDPNEFATIEEAREGTNTTKVMSPLRTKQAIVEGEYDLPSPYVNRLATSISGLIGRNIELGLFGVVADANVNEYEVGSRDNNSEILSEFFESSGSLTDKTVIFPQGTIAVDELVIKNRTRMEIVGTGTTLFGAAAGELFATNGRGAWAENVSYAIGDGVAYSGCWYSCTAAHLSSSSNRPGVGSLWKPELNRKPAVLRLHNLQRCRIRGFRIWSDGRRDLRPTGGRFIERYGLDPNIKGGVGIRFTTDTQNWLGEWAIGNNYDTNDAVMYEGQPWACLYETIPSTSADRPGLSCHWEKLPYDSSSEWGDKDYPFSAWNWLQDMDIVGFEYGLIYGSEFGMVEGVVPPKEWPNQQDEAQDSNYLQNVHFRSVMKCITGKNKNTGLDVQASHFYADRVAFSTDWWNDSDRWICRNNNEDKYARIRFDSACRRLMNVASDSAYGIYGRDVVWDGGHDEMRARNYITGDVIDGGQMRGFVGSSQQPVYQLAPGATGRLIVRDREFRRHIMGQPATTTDIMFIEGGYYDPEHTEIPGNTTMDVVLENLVIMDVQFNATGVPANKRFFIRGGRSLDMQNVELRGATDETSFRFNLSKTNLLTTADPRGDTMSTTQDTATKAGWSLITGLSGGHFCKQASSPPPGQSAFIEFASNGALGVVSTPVGSSGFRVTGGRDHLLSFWLKRISGMGQFSWHVKWYDFAGSPILVGTDSPVATIPVFNLNASSSAPPNEFQYYGFDHWLMGYAPLKAPSNASFAALEVRPGTTAIKFGIGDVQVR